eukprot:CAMPEP_0198703698 /NCGR_PEP_ID=MMETSP1468-20131203/389483_1 /TAXON_ID=1461545 /ORGANISM="Mantoniella sp, Strain CCMP1436" /LENGTH=101 /DNA_ID=CAMNT_0044462433 /DNA_START=456 /DNA_END=761 /DNA_ORIENTATION=-
MGAFLGIAGMGFESKSSRAAIASVIASASRRVTSFSIPFPAVPAPFLNPPAPEESPLFFSPIIPGTNSCTNLPIVSTPAAAPIATAAADWLRGAELSVAGQ